jgi:peptide/nickel transport system substrate-binding protein
VVAHEVLDKYGKDDRNHPVGTGPFQFKYWKEGVKLVLAKNPNYFEFENGQRLPFLDAVAITFIVDKQSVFMEFVKGNLDFLSGIDASYKDELLTSSGTLNPKYRNKFKLSTHPYLNTEYLGFLVDAGKSKSDNPLLKKEVRQAINYGFDRVKMIRFLRNNIGTPAYAGMVPQGLPSFDSSAVKGYSYQPQKAMELLAKAGYPNGKGMPAITLAASASYLDLCQYIQHELSKIGIELKIEVNPPATQREMISQSKLPFFRGSWIADYPDAENYLSLFYSKNFCPNGPNYTHFSNAEFDRLYEQSQNQVNDSLRYEVYKKMDAILMDEAPVVVLYYDKVMRLIQNNIEGLGNNSMNLLTLKRVKKGKR